MAGVGFTSPFVCLFIRTISEKSTQLGSSNMAYKCFITSSGNLFILGLQDQK